jgi:hypothetical protein
MKERRRTVVYGRSPAQAQTAACSQAHTSAYTNMGCPLQIDACFWRLFVVHKPVKKRREIINQSPMSAPALVCVWLSALACDRHAYERKKPNS